MKFDLENGLPVWVWGIAFLIVVLPFFFRPSANSGQFGPSLVNEDGAITESRPASLPTPTIPPESTVPVIIEIAPEPEQLVDEGYPEPEEPQPEGANQGYD